MPLSTATDAPWRVLLVMPDQWPRALLRAELIERGRDAVGARNLEEAMLCGPSLERGPVRVLVIDQSLCDDGSQALLKSLLSRHPGAKVLLLGRPTLPTPRGPWIEVIERPTRIGEVATEVERLAHG